jgi:L-ascorbate metabolism protein UlaG (beta-lactamase superfamily)
MNVQGLEVKVLGHATVKVSDGTKVIYFDPYILDDNPEKADLILITHDHYDHCDAMKVNEIRKDSTVVITTLSCKAKLDGNAETIKEGEEREFQGIKVKAVPAYNVSKPYHSRAMGIGFVVEFAGKKLYHAGDTDFIPEMKELKGIDIAFLPIGGTYTMNVKEAAQAALAIKPKTVIPMHFNAIEGTEADPEEFKLLVKKDIEVIIP